MKHAVAGWTVFFCLLALICSLGVAWAQAEDFQLFSLEMTSNFPGHPDDLLNDSWNNSINVYTEDPDPAGGPPSVPWPPEDNMRSAFADNGSYYDTQELINETSGTWTLAVYVLAGSEFNLSWSTGGDDPNFLDDKELRLTGGPNNADIDMKTTATEAGTTNNTGTPQTYTYTITLASTQTYHSADYDEDWEIEPLEVTRVINLYKANGYHIDANAHADGYGLGAGDTPVSGHHSADYDADWTIEPLEVTRVINLYKANGYHVDQNAHQDGYGLGAAP